jgi:hypothetical protein
MLDRTNELPDIDEADQAALELAIAMYRAQGKVQAQEIDDMLATRPWDDVAEFAAYSQQFSNLKLRPWHTPPCCVAIDDDDAQAAAFLRKMLDAGVSRWHPNPLRALEEAARKRARKRTAAKLAGSDGRRSNRL